VARQAEMGVMAAVMGGGRAGWEWTDWVSGRGMQMSGKQVSASGLIGIKAVWAMKNEWWRGGGRRQRQYRMMIMIINNIEWAN